MTAELDFARRSAHDIEGLLVGYEQQIDLAVRRCAAIAEVIDAARLTAKPAELEAVRARWLEAKDGVVRLAQEYAQRAAQQAAVQRLIKKLEQR